MNWAAKYIGIPYVDGAASVAGCSCWGLVCLVLATERGIALPTYGEISARDLMAAARRVHRDAASEMWAKIDSPRPFDVATMYASDGKVKVVSHVGVMSSHTDLLHVWKATHAVNMPITDPRVRFRIAGFYRHRELCDA